MSKTQSVVTGFLWKDGRILLLKRSSEVETFSQQWGGISGAIEPGETPSETLFREIAEETGQQSGHTIVRRGRSLSVENPHDEGPEQFEVHPFLVETTSSEIDPNQEIAAYEWVPPTAIMLRECVPALWRAYERVAPTVSSIASDSEHGAARLSIYALEVLRDRAGVLASSSNSSGVDELVDLASRLRQIRPGMAPLQRRIDRTMARARESGLTPETIETLAIEEIDRAIEAEASVVEALATTIDGSRVLTMSKSNTIERAIKRADPEAVYIATSHPGGEGIGLAESLAESTPVTLFADAGVADVLDRISIDAVVTGADTVLPDGRVSNKVGTRGTMLLASEADVTTIVGASTDKVTTEDSIRRECAPKKTLYDGDADIDVHNPLFDLTPAHAIDQYVTESGRLTREDLDAIVENHRAVAEWKP